MCIVLFPCECFLVDDVIASYMRICAICKAKALIT